MHIEHIGIFDHLHLIVRWIHWCLVLVLLLSVTYALDRNAHPTAKVERVDIKAGITGSNAVTSKINMDRASNEVR